MGARATISVRLHLFVLLLFTFAVAMGTHAPAVADASPTAPMIRPLAPVQSLRALLAVQQAKLTAADGGPEDCFGCSVAISGDTAVVGALQDSFGSTSFQGSAYVFVRSGAVWVQQAQLTAADGAADDRFGSSVAISGDTVVVGAPLDDDGSTPDAGSAYVFVRSGETWSQQEHLTAADGAADDRFGSSVAISGDTVVVGAPYDDAAGPDQGSSCIFTRSGATWRQEVRVTAADGAANDCFGSSVAVSGGTVAVGVPFDDVGDQTNQGSVCAFVRGDNTWSQRQLVAADGGAGDLLGTSVAVSGDTIVAGAHRDYGGQGTATVFTRSGSTWAQQLLRDELMGADDDYFGYSVAICGDIAVVGAFCDDVYSNDEGQNHADQGTVTVFARNAGKWSLERRLIAADGTAYDCLGYSVAVTGNTAVVGALYDNVGANVHQGSAYVFSGVVAPPGRPVARSPKGLISSRTPTFLWGVSGSATYQLRVYKGSSLIRTKTGITKPSWKCTKPLPRGVWLTWKVRGLNAAGPGAWSAKPRFKVR